MSFKKSVILVPSENNVPDNKIEDLHTFIVDIGSNFLKSIKGFSQQIEVIANQLVDLEQKVGCNQVADLVQTVGSKFKAIDADVISLKNALATLQSELKDVTTTFNNIQRKVIAEETSTKIKETEAVDTLPLNATTRCLEELAERERVSSETLLFLESLKLRNN